MGSSLIGRFVGPVSTLIALCMGGWYLMHHAPTEGDLAANAGALANADPNATNPLNQSPLGSTVSNNPASPAGLGSNAVAPVSAGSSANPRNVPPAQNPQAINPGVREPARPVGIPNGPAAVPPAQPNMQQPGMPPAPAGGAAMQAKPGDRIRIATFNIQDFGPKKVENADIMNVLAQIVRNFDVVAIQEVSSNNIPIIDRLLAVVNRSGAPYQGISSPRVGRTSQKEQYAYIWDSARIVMREQSNYMVNDAADLMHREPFVTSFRVKLPATATAQPFTFTLVNVHTDPDEVAQELNVLDDVFRSIRAYEYPEDDIILLGDLNVNYKQLGELGQIPGIITLMGTSNTNTRGDKQYDHILIDTNLTTEFIRGRSGVYSYEQSLGLSVQQALAISDHRPCWAEFMPVEQPHSPAMANGPSPANRNANSPPQSRL